MRLLKNNMNGFELVGFIASIASLILAIGAIWLSIVFFKMSNEASKATTEAAKGIDASVKRLENLFDKLYSDTFTMMKDTVSDMRKHIWNKPSVESDINSTKEISDSLKSEIELQVSKALQSAGINDQNKNQELSKKLEESIEEIFQKSKRRKQSIKSARVLSTIAEVQPITVKALSALLNLNEDDLAIEHLFQLREKGEITWDGAENMLNSDSKIKLVQNFEGSN